MNTTRDAHSGRTMTDAGQVLEKIRGSGVVLVARLPSTDLLDDIAALARSTGVAALEVTLDTPGALNWLHDARERWAPDLALGVGTVMDVGATREALAAGATFVVSPVLIEGLIDAAHEVGAVAMPGALTPTEIVRAHAAGADLVKVFPASLGGPSYLAALRAPLAGIPLVATGGVNIDNATAFIASGASAVGLGGSMLDHDTLTRTGFEALERNLRTVCERVGAYLRNRVATST